MIFTDRTVTIRNGKSTINEPVVLYRGDHEVSIKFTIMESKFRFKSGVNLVDSEKASYGQLAILAPYGGNVFSEIVKCEDGTVTFTLTKEMIDQLEEVGLYSFQIRLFDYYRESRVSIPPVEFGIEVREPVASEDHDNEVNNAIVGYSIDKVVDPSKENVGDTFDDNGQYNKTDWETGDRITEGKLNKIEDAIDTINQNEKNDVAALDKRVTNNYNVLNNTKANKDSIFSMSNMGQDVKEAMTGGSVAVVGKNAILTENIVDGQVTMDKLSEYDSLSLGDFSDCINSAGSGLWVPSKVFRKGFIENIKIKAIKDTDYARIVFYKKENESDLYYEYSKTFSLAEGINIIPIGIDMESDFYVGIGANDSALSFAGEKGYGNTVTNFNINDSANHISTRFNINNSSLYVFGVEVLYKSVKNRITLLEDVSKNIVEKQMKDDLLRLGIPSFKTISLMTDDSSNAKYRIILNYNDLKIYINDIYIPLLTEDKNVGYRKAKGVEIDIEPLPDEGHYVIYLFYNKELDTFCVKYHNGASLTKGLKDITEEHYLVFAGLLTTSDFNFLEHINNGMVKIILPNNLIITTEIKANKWFGKKYIALGDSITKGENSLDSYNAMVGDRYTDVAREEFGFKSVVNYGIGGSRITSHSNSNDGMIDRYNAMDDADLICVFGGTNDFGNNVPLGEIDDGDATHFKYALNELCKGLLNKYHSKTIYFITPIHRNDSKKDNVANGAGHILKDYVDAIKEICSEWGIPVLDLYSTYGINPFINIQRTTYMPDGLHPIPIGMRKLAEKNNNFIKTL